MCGWIVRVGFLSAVGVGAGFAGDRLLQEDDWTRVGSAVGSMGLRMW